MEAKNGRNGLLEMKIIIQIYKKQLFVGIMFFLMTALEIKNVVESKLKAKEINLEKKLYKSVYNSILRYCKALRLIK